MNYSPTLIIPSKTAEVAQTTQFTAALPTTIEKFTGTNVSAGTLSLSVYLVDSGSAGTNNLIIPARQIEAGEVFPFPNLIGHYLPVGAKIATQASGVGIVIRCSGKEVTNS